MFDISYSGTNAELFSSTTKGTKNTKHGILAGLEHRCPGSDQEPDRATWEGTEG